MKRQDCAIKEVNGFTRLDEGDRWKEQNLLARYRDLLPDQELDDDRVVLEARCRRALLARSGSLRAPWLVSQRAVGTVVGVLSIA